MILQAPLWELLQEAPALEPLVLVVSSSPRAMKKIGGDKRGRSLRGRHLRREVWSSLRTCIAHLINFFKDNDRKYRRGGSSEEEDFLKGSIALYKGTDTKSRSQEMSSASAPRS
jgi:hypothetical protein